MIQLSGVSKKYNERYALQPTTLDFPEGKTTVLIGQSGCGKSTMLRLIMGLIEPESGEITIGGVKLAADNVIETRRKMGYVVQDGGLFPHFTAAANATLMARHLNKPEDEINKRLHELSALTHFPEDGLHRYPAELSGGQRQRVSLMRALMLDPQVLLMDEPLAALDPMIRSKLQTDLKEIFQRLRKTVVFVTHDMAEAGYLGDQIVLLNEGQVVQTGTLEDLRERPASDFVREFISAQRSLVQL